MAPQIYPVTLLDSSQVIQYVYDESTQSLRTTATATIVGGDLTVDTSHLEDSMRLGDGTNFLTSTTVGPKVGLDVSVINGDLEVDLSHTDDSVRLGNGTNFLTTTTVGSVVSLDVNTRGVASSPTIYNVPAPLANTEYSQVLPAGTKKFTTKLRSGVGAANLQFAYVAGQSGTVFIKVPFGSYYEEEGLNLTSPITFYFQTDNTGQTLEMVAWI